MRVAVWPDGRFRQGAGLMAVFEVAEDVASVAHAGVAAVLDLHACPVG